MCDKTSQKLGFVYTHPNQSSIIKLTEIKAGSAAFATLDAWMLGHCRIDSRCRVTPI